MRLSPGQLGLPAGGRRRTPGLRREEIAVAAGVGLTWYTWLEQGKPIQVSAGFLDNLARAFLLTSAERAHLFALAQHRPPPLSPAAKEGEPARDLQPILDAITLPAYARADNFDVLAWNEANTRYFGDFAAIEPGERNVLRLMFTRSYHRRTMPDWEADARALLAKFRLNFGRADDTAAFAPLIAELSARSPDFRRMWAAHDVSDAGEGVTRLHSPLLGELAFRHQLLMAEAFPGATVVLFVPARPAVRLSRPFND